MRISRLSIENFRSVKTLSIDLPQICGLIGPNNAGKTNILLAIQRVLGREWITVSAFGEDDVYGKDPNRDIRIVLSLDPPFPYRRFKHAEPAMIAALSFHYTRYKVGPAKGQRRLEHTCLDPKGQPVKILAKAPKAGEKRQYEPLVGIPSDVREPVPLIYLGTNRSLKDHLPGSRSSLLRPLLEDVDRDLRSPAQTITVKQASGEALAVPRLGRFRDLIQQAMDVLRTEAFQSLEAEIKRSALRQLGFDPETDADKLDFFFQPFDTMDFYKALDLYVREGGVAIQATELGEGVQNAIVLAILQVFEQRRKRGAVLLIEEPEMFLHPQMQRALYKTLRAIGATNQVIYTTHSPHFVSIPEYREILLVRKAAEGTQVVQSSLPTDPKRREKLIKELDPARNELFFATRLLLVEGGTEKLALPEYAKRLGFDLDREGATIVEVGGKRNLPEFAAIAISFGIPTGVLYDEDSSDFRDDRGDEPAFNARLDALARPDGSVRVWRLSTKYEDELRKALGESKYQELCQKYPKVGRPTRARLIATEPELPIPPNLVDALSWLANKKPPLAAPKAGLQVPQTPGSDL